MSKLKERFVNGKILLQNMPAFLCGCKKTNAEQLDNMIDNLEEELILDKAEEIRVKNLGRLGTHENIAISEALRTLRVARKLGLIKRERPFPDEEAANAEKS